MCTAEALSLPNQHWLNSLLVLHERGNATVPSSRISTWGRGSSDAHCRDWGVDLHVAGLGHLARYEGECTSGQTKQSGVRRSFRVIDELVQNHARVAAKIERRTIAKNNADRAVGSGRNHTALVDEVTDLKNGDSCVIIYLSPHRRRFTITARTP